MQNEKTIASAVAEQEDNRATAKISGEFVTIAAIFGLTFAMILASRAISPSFGSWSQVETILYLSSFLVFCAFGQGLVILVRGLDLSIASVITLGGVLTASLMNGSNEGFLYLVPAILGACIVVGLISGIGVAYFRVPPFIMTMAVGLIVYSLCLGFTRGTPRGYPAPLLSGFMQDKFLGVPAPVYLLLAFVVFGTILQSYSVFGRKLNAVGNNPLAAYIAGLPSGVLIVSAYAMSALCAGFTGMMLAGYANGATLRMGDSYLLPSIAAVVVGGSSILGGQGNFVGTVGGALLLTALATILTALGIEQGWKTIMEGGVILFALIALREQSFAFLREVLGKRG
ncbi:ABC transporter permease [Oricola nitratireducens]|uniref:ABC transporter permease n=1 Tax=Oricola nitratireducens TaxID=2775868 RepID=UPI001867A857|nr:ABC transporter permease [Oricola nitratireducens]